jgi:hypothetical protein
MATIRDKILGLYIAFFNRAGDKAGVDYWENEATTIGEDIVIKELASGFATHPIFKELYDDLTDKEFVEEIYKNTLGSAGDIEGINYWTSQLKNGTTRSDMVSDFISLALDFDPNDEQYSNLSQEDIDIALDRKALISNKVETSSKYIDILEERTNINPEINPLDTTQLEEDTSYKASIKVLSNITTDHNSVDNTVEAIELIKDRDNATDIINEVSILNKEIVLDYVNNKSQSISNNISYINIGLGELSTFDTDGVSSVYSQTHWNKSDITFSFNETIPDSYNEYPSGGLTNNWTPLTQAQQDTVRSVTSEINNLLDIKLREVTVDGDIRFNVVSMEENTSGFSFYPSSDIDYGGDVFLSSSFNSDPDNYGLDRGEGGRATITHELGHALGLKHPFEEPNRLSEESDDVNHTIMSYIIEDDVIPEFTVSGLTVKLEYHILYPDLYSLYDISALQAVYGVNRSYHTEDNIYTTSYTDYKIETIWDAGGVDTIDLSNTKGHTTIDLKGGTLNSVDEYSLEDIKALHQAGVTNSDLRNWIGYKVTELYNEDLLYTGENNFGIAEGVIIENIKTGTGDDIVKDNMVDNNIYTNSGDDKIYIGRGGFDHIDGGEGNDSIYLNLLQNEVELTQIDNETYSIMAESFYAEFTNIETVYFIDNSSVQI